MTFADFKDWLQDRWSVFRAHSIHYQLKALLLTAYLSSVVATVIVAPPSSAAENQIGARIMVLDGDAVVGNYFIVKNESRDHWKGVTFSVGDGFTVKYDLVRASEKVTIYLRDFKKKVIRRRRGRDIPKIISAPADMELTMLSIECSEGVAIEPVAAEP